MVLQPFAAGHIDFVFECLRELRGQADYSLAQFEDYVRAHGLFGHADFLILVGITGAQPVGMLTCNRFAMPRYLGFGYELEEVVVHPSFQGRGHGKELVHAFLERARSEPEIRKVIVKTDDQLRAGKLYQRYFSVVATTIYGATVNRI